MLALFSLAKQNEYAKLKNIGNGPGKQYVMKSKNLNMTIVTSISSYNSWGRAIRYIKKLTINTSTWKDISLKKNSGCVITLVNILRIILPLCEEYPILIAIANVFSFIVSTLDP